MAEDVLTVRIAIHPIAQPRHRVEIRWKGRKAFPHHYIPDNHAVWIYREAVAIQVKLLMGGEPRRGPVVAKLIYLFPRPASVQKITTARYPAFFPKSGPGDIDNLLKSTFDALNGVAYVDDSQIWDVAAKKLYASSVESPGVIIQLAFGAVGSKS